MKSQNWGLLAASVWLGACSAAVEGEPAPTADPTGQQGEGGGGGEMPTTPPRARDAGVATFAADGPRPTEAFTPPAEAPPDGATGGAADAGAADTTGATCAPTAGGPIWVEEGAPVTATLRCATGMPLSGGAFSIADLPAGAVYDPAAARLSWKPALDQASVYLLTVTAQPSGETGVIKIGVADKFDDPKNVAIKDPTAYTEEFGLPVFHLRTTPAFDQTLVQLRDEWFKGYGNTCAPPCGASVYTPVTVTYRGHSFTAEGHYRGNTSLDYPKRNYTLKFAKDDKFGEPALTGGRMVKRRRLALITTFDDNSYLRWRLAFELWNRIEPTVVRIEHFSAVVYVNAKYQGLYAASDKIDDDMMKRNGMAESGNVYAGLTHNANFETLARPDNGGSPRARLCAYEGFSKKEGLPEVCDAAGKTVPAAFDDLLPLVTFVSKTDDATFRTRVASTVNLADHRAWFIMATAIMASDSYAKNGYHLHNPQGGPWRTVMWDYNASFGQTWNTVRAAPTDNPSRFASAPAPAANNLWKRLWNDATQGPALRARYGEVLRRELRVEDVLSVVDGLTKELTPSARRDERRWREAYLGHYGPGSGLRRNDVTTATDEMAYVRKWVEARWQYLRAVFPSP